MQNIIGIAHFREILTSFIFLKILPPKLRIEKSSLPGLAQNS